MHEPYCLAMVLCDRVHQDPATRKNTLLGTFSTFAAVSYPAPLQVAIYFALTDGQGEHDIKIRIINSEHIVNDDVVSIFEADSKITFPDPICVVETSLGMVIPVPESGVYHCELLCGSDVLMSRRIVADKIEIGETQ